MSKLWPLLLTLALAACASAPPAPTDQATQAPAQKKMPMPTGHNVPTHDARGQVVAMEDDSLVEGERLEIAAQDYRAQLESMFLALKDDLNQCYLPALKRDPSLQGYVTLQFQVRAGGKIKQEPTLGPSTLQNQQVVTCLLDLIQAQTYPEPFNGEYTDVERVFYFGEF